jgi:FdhE protein
LPYQERAEAMEVPPTDQRLLEALQDERDPHPELAQMIDLHEELISARSEIEVASLDPPLTRDEVARLTDERVPVLERWALPWDLERVSSLSSRICEIGGRHRPGLASQFEHANSLLNGDAEQAREVVDAFLMGGRVQIAEHPEETREMVSFVLIHALHPFLHAYAAAVAPLIVDKEWYQRLCPVCHGEPDFGYLEEQVGGLRLLCSRCDLVWTHKRGECAFCGNSERGTFAYYLSDDEVYRLYVCDACHRYLKVLDGRRKSAHPLLPIERIITVGMDISAHEQGYL